MERHNLLVLWHIAFIGKHLYSGFRYGAKEFPVQFRPPGDYEISKVFQFPLFGGNKVRKLAKAKRANSKDTANNRRYDLFHVRHCILLIPLSAAFPERLIDLSRRP
jgi:hypothetical protein